MFINEEIVLFMKTNTISCKWIFEDGTTANSLSLNHTFKGPIGKEIIKIEATLFGNKKHK